MAARSFRSSSDYLEGGSTRSERHEAASDVRPDGPAIVSAKSGSLMPDPGTGKGGGRDIPRRSYSLQRSPGRKASHFVVHCGGNFLATCACAGAELQGTTTMRAATHRSSCRFCRPRHDNRRRPACFPLRARFRRAAERDVTRVGLICPYRGWHLGFRVGRCVLQRILRAAAPGLPVGLPSFSLQPPLRAQLSKIALPLPTD